MLQTLPQPSLLLSRFRRGALLALTSLALWSSCGGAPEEQPNVVLISIDTMRPDYLGCYGYDRGVSPAIDAFAQGGTIFEDVTSASPWTLPSHATMVTGMYPSTHGVQTNKNGLTETTLASRLKEAGYQTYAVGNAHNVSFEPYGILAGCDEVDRVPEIETNGGPIFNRAERIVASGLRMISGRDPEKPFFLFLHFYDVHTDFTPLPKWESKYVEPYDGPITGVTASLISARNKIRAGERSLTPEDIRFLEQLYDAEIRTFDERLAVLFETLESQGILDETIVCITSDHGEEFGEHGSLLHGRAHYQELVRIPLILRGPGIPAGKKIAEPAHLVDVAPSLMSLVGLPILPGMDGYDLSLAWEAPGVLPEKCFLFSESDHNNIVDGKTLNNFKKMVRLGNMVLHYDMRTKEKELYDLESDPMELEDISEVRTDVVEHLFGKLEEFMSRSGSAKQLGEPSQETLDKLKHLGY